MAGGSLANGDARLDAALYAAGQAVAALVQAPYEHPIQCLQVGEKVTAFFLHCAGRAIIDSALMSAVFKLRSATESLDLDIQEKKVLKMMFKETQKCAARWMHAFESLCSSGERQWQEDVVGLQQAVGVLLQILRHANIKTDSFFGLATIRVQAAKTCVGLTLAEKVALAKGFEAAIREYGWQCCVDSSSASSA